MRPYDKYVVLMDARINLCSPDCSATQLVEVAALCQKNIPKLKPVPTQFLFWNRDRLNFRQIQMAILNICNP